MTSLRLGRIKLKGKHSIADRLPKKQIATTYALMAAIASQRSLSAGRGE